MTSNAVMFAMGDTAELLVPPELELGAAIPARDPVLLMGTHGRVVGPAALALIRPGAFPSWQLADGSWQTGKRQKLKHMC